MSAADILAIWRRAWEQRYGQPITEEHIADRFPGWMQKLAREFGEFDPMRCVVWL